MDEELIAVLEDLRSHFGDKPIKIISGCRCQKHNAKIPGAAPESFHTKGMAADETVIGVSAISQGDYLRKKYKDRYGIGQYPNRVHIDVRPGDPARWYQT